MNCPSTEDFVSCIGLRPPRVSVICPSLEDFVSCNGLRPQRASMICPSSEDFVSCNRLRPWRASMICPSSEDFVSYQWRTSTMIGHNLQTGTSQSKQRCIRSIKRMHYLDEGGRVCIGRLVDARMITALGWGRRLNPKSLWVRSNTQRGLGIVGSSAWIWWVIVLSLSDCGTIVRKRKLVLELTQYFSATSHKGGSNIDAGIIREQIMVLLYISGSSYWS